MAQGFKDPDRGDLKVEDKRYDGGGSRTDGQPREKETLGGGDHTELVESYGRTHQKQPPNWETHGTPLLTQPNINRINRRTPSHHYPNPRKLQRSHPTLKTLLHATRRPTDPPTRHIDSPT
jgi:hypothetical protein